MQTRVGVGRARKWADRIGNGLGPDDLFISADTDEVWIHIQMKKANKQVLTNIVCKKCFYQAKVRSLPCLLGTQSLIDSLKLLRLTDVTLACEDVRVKSTFSRNLSGDVKDRPPQAAVVPTCFKGKKISRFVIHYYVILMQQAYLQG